MPALAAGVVVLALSWIVAGRGVAARPEEVLRTDPATWTRPNTFESAVQGPSVPPAAPSHGRQAETGFVPGSSTAPAATDETYSVPGRDIVTPEPPAETTAAP